MARKDERVRWSALPLWRWMAAPLLAVAALLFPAHWLPPELRNLSRAALVVAAGWTFATGFEGRLRRARFSRDGRRASLIRLIVRLLIYALTLVAALGVLGVHAGSLTAGGVVLTAVIGLAGQTLFSNVLAGMVLVIWRPFEIGEHISLMSWQMPVISATYPHETLPSAHPMRVSDINLLHTICTADDGQVMLIPNSVVLPAIVRNHSRSGRCRVRVRGEAERQVGVERLWARLRALGAEFAAAEPHCSGGVEPALVDLTSGAIAFVLETWVPSVQYEEEVRSRLLLALARALEQLRLPDRDAGAAGTG